MRLSIRKFALIAILCFIAGSFSSGVLAQQKKIPKDPFRFSDLVTGKPIPEVLVLPRYSSATGIFIAPEGPAKATYRNYLDKPFVYRAGDPFILKTPKFIGLPLFPVVIGKGGSLEGILIVAPRYRPMWFENLWQTRDIWNTRDIRNLQLTPIPEDEWSLVWERKLNPLIEEPVLSALSVSDYQFWGLYEPERKLYIRYNKNERELVRKFFQS